MRKKAPEKLYWHWQLHEQLVQTMRLAHAPQCGIRGQIPISPRRTTVTRLTSLLPTLRGSTGVAPGFDENARSLFQNVQK
jgi:hypothetical protein